MEIIPISTSPLYDDTQLIIRRILRIWNALKRDVSRLVWYQLQEPSDRLKNNIVRCKNRIFDRLKEVDGIRNHKKIQNEEQWNNILHEALSQVYKHSDTPDVREKVKLLIWVDRTDTSKVGIHFLQVYMRIIARIPDNQLYLPFKP